MASIDNLYSAYKKAQTNNRWDIYRLEHEEGYVEDIIENLHNDLINDTFTPDQYRRFTVFNGIKMRNVDEPSYRDRILHRAIVDSVQKLFERTFIGTSYAVTRGKGQHRAVKKIQEYLRAIGNEQEVYVYQGDVRHYYESIVHGILFFEIKRIVRDKRLLNIWWKIISGYNNGMSENVGIPIGAVISQLSANIYLNKFDHYVKEKLFCKYYVRYMDDFVIIDCDKKKLHGIVELVTDFLNTELSLKLNSNSKLYNSKQGIDFCGYRIFADRTRPRKRNLRRAKNRLKAYVYKYQNELCSLEDVDSRLQSFFGMMQHANARRSYYSIAKIVKPIDYLAKRI